MFIVFEGVDGTGKSTQLEKCKKWLEELGHRVTVCRDPGSTSLGSRLRSLLLEKSELKIDVVAEMFLFMSARSQMVTEIIAPALQRGEVVLCDRFLLSTIVYQGHAGNLPPEHIRRIGQTAIQGSNPDLILVFDAPLSICMKRVGTQQDRLESRGEDYLASVKRGFLAEAASDKTIRVIDASGDTSDIHTQVIKAVTETLNL